jgi:hypothetical protein
VQIADVTDVEIKLRLDAESVEMELAIRLSDGCAELRGAAFRVGETDWAWSDSAGSRSPQEWCQAEGGQDLISHLTLRSECGAQNAAHTDDSHIPNWDGRRTG